jgi:hypothetical protein
VDGSGHRFESPERCGAGIIVASGSGTATSLASKCADDARCGAPIRGMVVDADLVWCPSFRTSSGATKHAPSKRFHASDDMTYQCNPRRLRTSGSNLVSRQPGHRRPFRFRRRRRAARLALSSRILAACSRPWALRSLA